MRNSPSITHDVFVFILADKPRQHFGLQASAIFQDSLFLLCYDAASFPFQGDHYGSPHKYLSSSQFCDYAIDARSQPMTSLH